MNSCGGKCENHSGFMFSEFGLFGVFEDQKIFRSNTFLHAWVVACAVISLVRVFECAFCHRGINGGLRCEFHGSIYKIRSGFDILSRYLNTIVSF